MATLKYWLWLSTRKGLRPEQAIRLLEHFGTPEAAYFADPGEYALLEGLPPVTGEALLDKDLAGVEAILADCDRLGVRILTIGDADYPDRLKNIFGPPAVLYVKGRLPAFDEELAVTVVGSRKPSEYGRRMAARLGLELARGGALVVSGIAQGLDTEALKGALKGGGGVVSVLGCGVDVHYPWQNRYLYEDVAAAGALISEYPPGTEPEGWHFPVRNRILSGLSLGAVAVECTLKSGTMSTVNQAMEQDRDIFAVPGNVDAPLSEGPNRLIQQGAKLVTCARDIFQEYVQRFPGKFRRESALTPEAEAARLAGAERTEPKKSAASPQKPIDTGVKQEYIDKSGLADDQVSILTALGEQSLLAEDLIEDTGIPPKRVLSALTLLQIQGYVEERPGKRFQALVRIQAE